MEEVAEEVQHATLQLNVTATSSCLPRSWHHSRLCYLLPSPMLPLSPDEQSRNLPDDQPSNEDQCCFCKTTQTISILEVQGMSGEANL
jgi:hypothetical protein